MTGVGPQSHPYLSEVPQSASCRPYEEPSTVKDKMAYDTSTVSFVVIVDATKQLTDRLKVAVCWAKPKFIRYLKSGHEVARVSQPLKNG